MTHAKHSGLRGDLATEVANWRRAEEEDRELNRRVAAALDDIKGFVAKYRSDLERRKSKLIQTSGFKDETRGMEAAIAKIDRLLSGGGNISSIFAAIDAFLERYEAEDTIAREHIRTQLADAREHFLYTFHDSIRGTRLSDLMDILYFLPYGYWRSRGVEKRNFRAPSAAEVLKLLEELGSRGVDVNGIDTVQLAAIIRIKLGITPRMDYHLMSSNRLAAQVTDEENISRFASQQVPLDEVLCRSTTGILANIRRWSAACFGGGSPPASPASEAEMLQIACLSADTIRLSGTEDERAADYLWLLSTVMAGARTPLREALARRSRKDPGYQSVRERITRARTSLDETAVLTDRLLVSRWSEAREQLTSLTVRAEAIAAKGTPAFGDLTELDNLKERRSDVVKSLIKLSDSLQLVEPSLLDLLTSPAVPALRQPAGAHLRVLDPTGLKDRNRSISEETRMIARQELEKLRRLIARITTMSREGLTEAAAQLSQERLRAGRKPVRKTADGAELGTLSAADVQAKLRDLLRKMGPAAREFKGKVDGVRTRTFKGDLQHALRSLQEKAASAVEVFDRAALDSVDPPQAVPASDRIVPLLREIMSALAKVSTRVNSAKLTPAERQPFLVLMYAAQAFIGEDLRDIERLRAELAERSADTQEGAQQDVAAAAVVDFTAAPERGARGADVLREGTVAADATARTEEPRVPAARTMADLARAANGALKPVQEMLTALRGTLASRKPDRQAVRAAARALRGGIAEARDLVLWNLRQIEAVAAGSGMTTDEYAGKCARWQDQLLALDGETDRLLQSTEAAAALETAFRDAAALEKEISAAATSLSTREVTAADVVPLRERCVLALQTMAPLSGQLRETQEWLARSTQADWRILKTAAAYLKSGCADLAGLDRELACKRERIEKIRNLVESELARPG